MPTTLHAQHPEDPSHCPCGGGAFARELRGRYPVLPADVHTAVTSMASKGVPFARIAKQTGLSLHDVRRVVLAWAQREAAAAAQAKRAGRDRRNAGEAPAFSPPAAPRDRAAVWLRFAGVAVGLVAVAAAAVSYEAQWRLVFRDKHELGVSYVQAAIPDLGSLVFACFGIALALHGRRAIRARLLNVLCVGISVAMNALAARPGWAGLAVWVMSPVIYALASDTLIGVVRAYVIARQRRLREALADDGVTPLRIVGAALLWLLRLAFAPLSTVKGFHRWVKSLPAAPPIRPQAGAGQPPRVAAAAPEGPGCDRRAATSRVPRGGTKQAQFLTLVVARYGPLAEFDITAVSRAAAELAPEAALHPGTARKVLRARVLAAQNGGPR